MTTDVHTFEADDNGITCVRCGLPDENARHQTPARVLASIDATLVALEAQIEPLRAQELRAQQDHLIWSLVVAAREEGLIQATPAFGFIAFNVTTIYDHGDYDHGEHLVTASLDGAWTEDGTMFADTDSEAKYLYPVVQTLGCGPTDYKFPYDVETYYYRWSLDIDRLRTSQLLRASWQWTQAKFSHPGTFELDNVPCEEFIGERRTREAPAEDANGH